jgi:hypothetical protein
MRTDKITFHESYGSLPTSTLRLIRKYNVSPADFDFMLDQFSGTVQDGWVWVNEHIVSNSETGMYRPRFF